MNGFWEVFNTGFMVLGQLAVLTVIASILDKRAAFVMASAFRALGILKREYSKMFVQTMDEMRGS